MHLVSCRRGRGRGLLDFGCWCGRLVFVVGDGMPFVRRPQKAATWNRAVLTYPNTWKMSCGTAAYHGQTAMPPPLLATPPPTMTTMTMTPAYRTWRPAYRTPPIDHHSFHSTACCSR